MGPMRRTFIVLASFAVCAIVILVSYSTDQIGLLKPPQVKWMVDRHGYLVESPGCRIPTWDPFDPSVLPFYERITESYKCSGRHSFLKIKANAVMTMDESSLNFFYGITRSNVTCTYKPILRDRGDTEKKRTDNKFKFGASVSLPLDTPISDEFLHVTCSMGSLPSFTQFIPLVPLKPGVEKRCDEAEKASSSSSSSSSHHEKLNIIIVGIDSISKLNFLRHFRKTRRFLSRMSSTTIELHGYTKVADNTFPNLVPLLTGHFVEHYWNETMRNMFFDDIDLVWKGFSAAGYRTMMAEDAPNIATFNYLKKGFRDPPTDYYFRPFALAVEKSKMKAHSKNHCFQTKMEIDVLFDYLKNFVHTMDTRPFFAFTFVARLTHDKLNAAGYADDPAHRLLRNLNDTGVLNRSLVVFMSDHGIRFGPIRQTYIGKFEERMPFIFLLFPPWFFTMYPKFAANLRKNQRRLTTPFDIHATLVHILNISSRHQDVAINISVSGGEYGHSLLTEISPHRTCADAAILPHWCACQTHTQVSARDEVVTNAAEALIDTINDWTSRYGDKCARLRVKKVLDARVGQPNEEVLRFIRHVNDVVDRHVLFGDKVEGPVDYLLTISATPSGALFEGTVRYAEGDRTYKVLDDISRINLYGNQSSCIRDARLRKFCYCKKRLLFAKREEEHNDTSSVAGG